ncbi:MAG: SBBP repeat-containing protein, partial [Acidobacteriia bacterium]|nr:SBBP repeat-containing protein [Terriglobia bacterium]
MRLVGANATATLSGVEELPGKSNYFLGNDPKRWHTNIPNYRKVAARNVYPGIDLVYYGDQRQLEYDFVVAPGADPSGIRFAIETGSLGLETGNSKLENRQPAPNPESGTPNPGSLRIDADGDLVVQLDGGEVRFHKPVVYQEQLAVASLQSKVENNRQSVDARYVLRPVNPKSQTENPKFEIAFALGPYNKALPLVIDPVLSYSTYLGGNQPGTPGTGLDMANAIAVSSDGSAFIAGETDSLDFPTVHALQPETGGPFDIPDDAFVAKISPDGSALLYSTYLGGSQQDRANGIAVDSFGNAYITGSTISEDFPHSEGVFDPNCGVDGHCNSSLFGGLVTYDAFVTKLNPAGSAIVYSGFLGGRGHTLGFGIAVDVNGNAFVTGATTASANFPASGGVLNGLQVLFGGGVKDAYIAKISPTGEAIRYITYLGGSDEDEGLGIAADNNNFAYATGFTCSSDFPINNPLPQDPVNGINVGANCDAFVTKVDTSQIAGADLIYSTYLGGAARDQGNGITNARTGLRAGALMRMQDFADHADVRQHYPTVA